MIRLALVVVVVVGASFPVGADEEPIQPDEAKVIPSAESAHFGGTAYPIPLDEMPAFDKTKAGWRCSLLGSDVYTVRTPKGRKLPVMQGQTKKMGETIDVWVKDGQLSIKYAFMTHPVSHVVVTKDNDLISAMTHLKDAVRGSSAVSFDQKTGLLYLTMAMWSVKERSVLSEMSLYVCR